MKVLIVDDEVTSVKEVFDYCIDNGWDCEQVDFDKCYEKIMCSNPDIVILDWCVDPGDDSGMPIFESIWINGYRPVVIFSGNIETISFNEEYKEKNLIQMFPKGDEQPVIDFLEKYKDYFSVLSEYRRELGASLIQAFDGIDQIRDNLESAADYSVVKYLLAKRTVNYFDLERSRLKLPPWGMYLYPSVLSESLSTCDLLRRVSKDTDLSKIGEADDYLMVLTPSCDMYEEKGIRVPKVTDILCAKCVDKKMFSENMRKKKVISTLGIGYNRQWVPLPSYKNVCPAMTVDMKKLKVIHLSDIRMTAETSLDEDYYLRACSIDSPFREQIVWAFMQNACRPGVPDRDFDSWADEILK